MAYLVKTAQYLPENIIYNKDLTQFPERYRNIIGEEDPYLGDKGYFPTRYPRATYAAMIEYIDILV